MSSSECWYKNPQPAVASALLVISTLFTVIGRLVVPPWVVRYLHSDVAVVVFFAIILYFASLMNEGGNMIALSVLVIYIGTFTMQTSEGFCPSSTKGHDEEGASRCNYTLHPELQSTPDSPTLVTPSEWLGPEASAPPPPPSGVPELKAYEEDDNAAGADFNASFLQ